VVVITHQVKRCWPMAITNRRWTICAHYPVESCVIGMIINANQESSLGVHIDTHPDNYGAYADDVQRYLAEMLALG